MERKTRIPVTRMSMFYDDLDCDLDLDMAREFIEHDSNFRVVLFRIDRANTQMDDVYGESSSSEVRFQPPVELVVSGLKVVAGEIKNYGTNGSLTYMDKGNLNFAVLSSILKEKDVDIRRGDFIGYNFSQESLEYFTVINDGRINGDNGHTLYGIKPYYRSIVCVTVDKNQFKAL